MELKSLAVETLAKTMQRLDPLVLVVDLDGCVLDRIECLHDRLPVDLCRAESLASVLSAPVLADWHGLMRDALARRESLASMAILDGRGHAMVASPSEGPEALTVLAIFPGTLCTGPSFPQGRLRSRPLLHHEWGPLDSLSRGQLDTLRSVTLGLTNDGIAQRVHRTKRAIEWHIRFLNQLLGVHGREDLAAIGRETGLCCFSDSTWSEVLGTRPSRRDSGAPPVLPEPKPLRVA